MRDPNHDLGCPLTSEMLECKDGWREGAKRQCRWWQHLYGKDPQSEQMIDKWDCAVPWIPITTIETSQMSKQTSASVDKVANEMASVRTAAGSLANAVRIAGENIRQGIETGGVGVMLPSPESDRKSEREPSE